MLLRDLLPVVHAQRAVYVLECIFSERKVAESLALGYILQGIKAGEYTPQEVLHNMKVFLSAHMKKNFYDYDKTLAREKSNLQRILTLQERLANGITAVLTGVFFGMSTFLFRILFTYMQQNGIFSFEESGSDDGRRLWEGEL